MPKNNAEQLGTTFLNVDLDIISNKPLDQIVEAFGKRLFALHSGRWVRRYSASFEWGAFSIESSADRLIRKLVGSVERLPRSARRLWNTANVREFNIGIEAAVKSQVFELRLRPATLAAVKRVNGTIVVTVYAPERPPGRHAKKRRSNAV